MNAKVNKDVCISCGMCTELQPDVFRMDNDGLAEAYQSATEDNRNSVQEAIDSCPTAAIFWDEQK